jgi:hypothetical protein
MGPANHGTGTGSLLYSYSAEPYNTELKNGALYSLSARLQWDWNWVLCMYVRAMHATVGFGFELIVYSYSTVTATGEIGDKNVFGTKRTSTERNVLDVHILYQ